MPCLATLAWLIVPESQSRPSSGAGSFHAQPLVDVDFVRALLPEAEFGSGGRVLACGEGQVDAPP